MTKSATCDGELFFGLTIDQVREAISDGVVRELRLADLSTTIEDRLREPVLQDLACEVSDSVIRTINRDGIPTREVSEYPSDSSVDFGSLDDQQRLAYSELMGAAKSWACAEWNRLLDDEGTTSTAG